MLLKYWLTIILKKIMTHLLTKKTFINMIFFLLLLILTGCSSNQSCIKINNHKIYFNTSSLITLHMPDNITLPLQSNLYKIPILLSREKIYKKVDIFPPEESMKSFNIFNSQDNSNINILVLNKNWKNNNIWLNLINKLKQKKFSIVSYQHINQTITTNWITWENINKKYQYESKYQISFKKDKNYHVLIVKNIGLRKKNKNFLIKDTSIIQCYNDMMINFILKM